jgi:hypothetical protein
MKYKWTPNSYEIHFCEDWKVLWPNLCEHNLKMGDHYSNAYVSCSSCLRTKNVKLSSSHAAWVMWDLVLQQG